MPPGEEDGQDPRHRRDGGRTARRRHRYAGGVPRTGVRGVHGRPRRREAGPERLQDGAPRRQGPCRQRRNGRPQGCRERDAPRVDPQGRRHPLRHRHRHGPEAVPGDGLRIPERHRTRGQGADDRQGGQDPRLPSGVRRRREQRHRAVPPVHRRQGREDDRMRGRREGGGHGEACRHHDQRHHGRLPRHEIPVLPGRLRADRARVFHIGRSGLSRHRSGARLSEIPGQGPVRRRHRRPGRGRVRVPLQDRGHNPGHRELPRRRLREGDRPDPVEGRPDGDQPVGPRGQGRGGHRQVQGEGHP